MSKLMSEFGPVPAGADDDTAPATGDTTDRRVLADLVLQALRAGTVPWHYPTNAAPPFGPVFGAFSTGEPADEAAADYGELEAILAATGARIVHHRRVAKPRCERPPGERILLPPRAAFLDEPQYRATRTHEVLHYLEQPGRVGWIGSDHQAELVAEVGTGLLWSHLRLPPDRDVTNIDKWLPAWAAGVRADPAYLFDAVAQAGRAVAYLLALSGRHPRRRPGTIGDHP
jgi:antirestriction protein ArdC